MDGDQRAASPRPRRRASAAPSARLLRGLLRLRSGVGRLWGLSAVAGGRRRVGAAARRSRISVGRSTRGMGTSSSSTRPATAPERMHGGGEGGQRLDVVRRPRCGRRAPGPPPASRSRRPPAGDDDAALAGEGVPRLVPAPAPRARRRGPCRCGPRRARPRRRRARPPGRAGSRSTGSLTRRRPRGHGPARAPPRPAAAGRGWRSPPRGPGPRRRGTRPRRSTPAGGGSSARRGTATSPSTASLTTATFHGPQWTIAARVLGRMGMAPWPDQLADVEDRQHLAAVGEDAREEGRGGRAGASADRAGPPRSPAAPRRRTGRPGSAGRRTRRPRAGLVRPAGRAACEAWLGDMSARLSSGPGTSGKSVVYGPPCRPRGIAS